MDSLSQKIQMVTVNTNEIGRVVDVTNTSIAEGISSVANVTESANLTTKITGDVIDVSGLTLNTDHALDGVVTGKLGKARVETIIAGGYNIQCEHYRALVKEIK